jgi:hypothetical protein
MVRQARIAPDPYRAVRERSVEAAPGTAWNYDGGGVWLLGLILNKVSGLPLDPRQKRLSALHGEFRNDLYAQQKWGPNVLRSLTAL